MRSKKITFVLFIAVICVCLLSSCEYIVYEDTNGEDDFSLQTITEQQILTQYRYSATEVAFNALISKKYWFSDFSGVCPFCKLQKDKPFSCSIMRKKGNARVVVCSKNEVVFDFPLDGTKTVFDAGDYDTNLYFILAGESADLEFEIYLR